MKGGCRVNVGARLSCGSDYCVGVSGHAVNWGRTTQFGDYECAEARLRTRLRAGGETGPVFRREGPKMGQNLAKIRPEAAKTPRIEFF